MRRQLYPEFSSPSTDVTFYKSPNRQIGIQIANSLRSNDADTIVTRILISTMTSVSTYNPVSGHSSPVSGHSSPVWSRTATLPIPRRSQSRSRYSSADTSEGNCAPIPSRANSAQSPQRRGPYARTRSKDVATDPRRWHEHVAPLGCHVSSAVCYQSTACDFGTIWNDFEGHWASIEP